jgi:hypothetical protein
LITSKRFGLGRFEVRSAGSGLVFRDWLLPGVREIANQVFDGLEGLALEQAWFEHGFARPAYSAAAAGGVADAPRQRSDALFWQFPCRTEAAAWDNHASMEQAMRVANNLHVYLGLPWATWIDLARKQAQTPEQAEQMTQQQQLVGTRLAGLRGALLEVGLALRVHTVCQHVYWQDMVPVWQRLGVTDVWLSHCPPDAPPAGVDALVLHPWALYAVNVEDPQRRAGLLLGKDPAQKTVLASFAGAYLPHYLSDVRLRLRALADEPGFVVRVTDEWHFEKVVYQHQIAGQALLQDEMLDESVASYNALLSESVFALCPAGAGPNSLRLWEALAVGAVPVLLGVQPMLPKGGSLPAIDWERIVLRVPDEEISSLPQRLRAMPLPERRERQQLGLQAYAAVKAQRCF